MARESVTDGFKPVSNNASALSGGMGNYAESRNKQRKFDVNEFDPDDAMHSLYLQRNGNTLDDLLSMDDAPTATSKQPEVPLWELYQKGDASVVSPLLKELKPTIDKGVERFGGGNTNLRTQAKLLSLNAVKSYDPSKGANLNTHVINHLQRLQRISAQRGSLVRIPENAAFRKKALEKTMRDLEIELDREPSLSEIADASGMSIDKIQKLMGLKGYAAESEVETASGDTLVASPKKTEALYTKYIYNELDPIDKKIYEWSTGFGGVAKLRRNQMAQKLKISEAAVSMRAAKIANKFERDMKMIGKMFHG